MLRLNYISNEGFSDICRVIRFKNDVDPDDLWGQLGGLDNLEVLERESPYRTMGEKNKAIEKIIRLTYKQEEVLEALYRLPEQDRDQYGICYIPPFFGPGLEAIKTTRSRFKEIRAALKPKPITADVFEKRVLKWANLFMEFTGQPVKTNNNFDTMKETPMFQQFAEKVCEALDGESPKNFERDLHEAVINLRRKGLLLRSR